MPLSKQKNRERMRKSRLHKRLDTQLAMRLRGRKLKAIRYCEACGYSQTVDTHHGGEQREKHALCPSCHGLITRHIKTLGQLLPLMEAKSVQPKLPDGFEIITIPPGVHYGFTDTLAIDADGNPMPEILPPASTAPWWDRDGAPVMDADGYPIPEV